MSDPSPTMVTAAEPAMLPSSHSTSQSTIDDVDTSPSMHHDEPSSQSQDSHKDPVGPATENEKPAADGPPRAEHARSTSRPDESLDGRDPTTVDAAPKSAVRTASAALASASSNVTGHKRMASGSLKQPPPIGRGAASATATSTAADLASSNRIGELSAQLSARLSYAFVKVQHGWESRSLDEVEVLAEQQQQQQKARSPAMRHGHPQTAGVSRARVPSLSRESSGLSEANSQHSSVASDQETRLALAGSRTTEGASRSPSGSQTQTYESFWRDHGSATKKTVSQILEAQRATGGPARPAVGSATARLAPSAPIDSAAAQHPRRRRAPYRSRPQPPTLPNIKTTTNGTGELSALSSARSPAFPATPPPPSATSSRAPDQLRTPGPRTPSEKAAMEQDAVETLLFMSSPAHSHHSQHPNLTANSRQPVDHTATIYSPPPSSTTPTRDRNRLSAAGASPQRYHHQHHRSAHHAALRRVILDPSPGHDDGDENDDRGSPRHRRRHEQRPGIPTTKLATSHACTPLLRIDDDPEDEIDKLLDAMSSDDDMVIHDVADEVEADDDDAGGVVLATNGIRR